MTAPVTSAFRQAVCRANPKLRFYFEIALGGVTYRFHNGADQLVPSAGVVLAENLVTVGPLSRAIDPLDPKPTQSKVIVTLHLDPLVKSLVVANRIMGRSAKLYIGAASLGISDFYLYFGGTVGEPRYDGSKRIAFELKGGLSYTFDNAITLYSFNDHPLQIAKTMLDKSGVPASSYTASDLDPSTAKYDIISRFVFNNALLGNVGHNDPGSKPQRAIDLLCEILGLIDALPIDDEDGTIRVLFFDSTLPIADTWTDDDFWDFTQHQQVGPLKNRITCLFGALNDNHTHQFMREDTASQDNWGDGTNKRIESAEFDFSQWLAARSGLGGNYDAAETPIILAGDPAGTTFKVGLTLPMSGLHWEGDYPDGGQPPWAVVDATHTVFCQIDDEIIEIDQVTFDRHRWVVSNESEPGTGNTINHDIPGTANFRIKTRGCFNTVAAMHRAGAMLIDVTPAQFLATRKLNRFHDGAPIVRMRTKFDKYPIQLGDFVALVTAKYVAYGANGLTASTKWQVIGKTPQPNNEQGYIEWTLMRAVDPGEPAQTTNHIAFWNRRLENVAAGARSVLDKATGEWRSITGANQSSAGGFNATITSGRAAALNQQTRRERDATVHLKASKDSYVGQSLYAQALFVQEVNAGDPVPGALPAIAPISKLTTDVVGIIAIDDKRLNTALDGALLVADSVLATRLAGDARSQHGVFFEPFESLPNSWYIQAGSGAEALVTTGQAGGKSYQAQGYRWREYPTNIPFDPSKLYRIRARARRTATSDATRQKFYCGVTGIAADGSTLVNASGANLHSGQHYIAANAADGALWPLNAWQEFTGWLFGWAAAGSAGPASDQNQPGHLHSNVRYFRPMFIVNYDTGPSGNVMEVDSIVIDIFDEEALNRAPLAVKQMSAVANPMFTLASKG